MLVTVMADASFCDRLQVAGYGYYVVSDRKKTKGGGFIKEPVLTSVTAEFMAVAMAVTKGINCGVIDYGDALIIQTDCTSVIQAFNGKRKYLNTQEREALEYLVALRVQHCLTYTLRHVKGHTNRPEPRYAANRFCDDKASKYLAVARKKARINKIKKQLDKPEVKTMSTGTQTTEQQYVAQPWAPQGPQAGQAPGYTQQPLPQSVQPQAMPYEQAPMQQAPMQQAPMQQTPAQQAPAEQPSAQRRHLVPEQQKVRDEMSQVVRIFAASNGQIRPHCIVTGPSGSGKSHLIKTLAEDHNLHFIEVNAAQLTKEGTSGNSLSKSLARLTNTAGQPTICFVDEFDKLFISGNSNSSLAHEVTNGVQNEFLKVLESETTEVFGDYGKYHSIPISNVLFIFAGAFNGEENLTLDRLREFGIKTEFLGRAGLIYNLEKLSINSMAVVLQNSSLLKKYMALYDNVSLETVINDIMTVVASVHDKNTLGIRLLDNLINQYFIKGGRLSVDTVRQTSFQTKLSFTVNGSEVAHG